MLSAGKPLRPNPNATARYPAHRMGYFSLEDGLLPKPNSKHLPFKGAKKNTIVKAIAVVQAETNLMRRDPIFWGFSVGEWKLGNKTSTEPRVYLGTRSLGSSKPQQFLRIKKI